MSEGVKFVRIRGRIVPINAKKNDSLKQIKSEVSKGAAYGSAGGAAAGSSLGLSVFRNNMRMPSPRFASSMVKMAKMKGAATAIKSGKISHAAIYGLAGLQAGMLAGAVAGLGIGALKKKKK